MVKVNNKNKELETIVKELGFKKKIETACAGYSVWKYETYYNPSIRCRVEYGQHQELYAVARKEAY